jgi:hypothetical protein
MKAVRHGFLLPVGESWTPLKLIMFSQSASNYLHPFSNTSIYLHMGGPMLHRGQAMSKPDAKQQGTVVVTGASSGIGYATARRLVESALFAPRIPFRYLLFVCTCAMTLAIPLAGCKPAPGNKPFSPAGVEVAAVVHKPVRLSDEFNGRVASINSVDVRARVTGYVDNVAYREGDSVKRGDLLFVIDPRPFRDALDSAKATWSESRQRPHSRIFRQKGHRRWMPPRRFRRKNIRIATPICPRALLACMRQNPLWQRQNSISPLRKYDLLLMDGPAGHSSRGEILHKPIKRCSLPSCHRTLSMCTSTAMSRVIYVFRRGHTAEAE